MFTQKRREKVRFSARPLGLTNGRTNPDDRDEWKPHLGSDVALDQHTGHLNHGVADEKDGEADLILFL